MGSAARLCTTLHECSSKRHIAILGGSFDPITDGHLKCACEIVHARKAQEVWIVPCGPRPDKPSLKTPYMHRLTMCHLAVNTTFGSQFPIRVSDIEMPEESALSTYHLMQRLKQDYPDKEFMFVIGADLIDSLKSWGAPGVPDAGVRLWNECRFLVLGRPGYEVPESLPANFTQLTAAAGTTIVTEEVSSSEIRRRIAKPQPQSYVAVRRSGGGSSTPGGSAAGAATTLQQQNNFGESEKYEIEQARARAHAWTGRWADSLTPVP